jgi:hypothetical protein
VDDSDGQHEMAWLTMTSELGKNASNANEHEIDELADKY